MLFLQIQKIKKHMKIGHNGKTQSIPDELHEERKKNGYYHNGIAIIPGKIWRGPLYRQILGSY